MSSRYAFTKGLKEVRFLFCQTSEHSAAVRYVAALPPDKALALDDEPRRLDEQEVAMPRIWRRESGELLLCRMIDADGQGRSFLTRAYPTMKKNNPQIPILIREAQGTLPKIYARYGTSGPPETYTGFSKSPRAGKPSYFSRAAPASCSWECGGDRSVKLQDRENGKLTRT